MKYEITTAPTSEIVSLADAKVHLRTVAGDTSEDTAVIQPLISAAREYCENITGQAFSAQTIKAYPVLWGTWELPILPANSITSIKYYDEDSIEYELSTSDYLFDSVGGVIRITEPPSEALKEINPIIVEYSAGYDTSEAPKALRQAMLLLIGHWYDNREAVIVGTTSSSVDIAVRSLLSQYKVWWF